MNVDPEIQTATRRAINHLAGVCDHATSRDDVGFSAATAGIGHELANLPDRYWQPGTYVLAAQIATHHRNQVEKTNALSRLMMDQVAILASGPAESKDLIPTFWAAFDAEEDSIVLSVDGRNAMFTHLRSVPGAFQPAGRGRIWVVPGKSSFALIGRMEGYECGEGVQTRIIEARAEASPDDLMTCLSRVIDATSDRFLCKFEYNEYVSSVVRRHLGARWDSAAKVWTLPLIRGSVDLIRQLTSPEFGFVTTSRADAATSIAWEKTELSPQEGKAPPKMEIDRVTFPGTFFIKFTFCQAWVDAIKALPKGRRHYVADRKGWMVASDPETAEMLAEQLGSTDPKIDETSWATIDAARQQPVAAPGM